MILGRWVGTLFGIGRSKEETKPREGSSTRQAIGPNP